MLYTDVVTLSGGVVFAGIQGLRRDAPARTQSQRGEQ